MDEDRIRKMEVDYSSTVDTLIPSSERLAKEGKLHDALEQLLTMEKSTRLASDMSSTSRLLVAIVKICYETHNYDLLNEHILLLSKKRSQFKNAIAKMVQECLEFVRQTANEEEKLRLIDSLRTVTEGKIYVEHERACLTKILADMHESRNEIAKACKLMTDLQVETYNTMERREKVEFLLDQMRLCLLCNDYIRTQIISKKISLKYFDKEDTDDLKLQFYKYMIDLDKNEGTFLEITKHYRAIYDTKCIKDDSNRKFIALKAIVLSICLAPYDNEQSNLMNIISKDRELEQIPMYHSLLKGFLTMELMNWDALCATYERELRSLSEPDIFVHSPAGDKAWKLLRDRVIEHNLRVISSYYTRISITRISQLLNLPKDEIEEFLSNLVFKKTVYARIDDLKGIVSFLRPQDPNEVLNEWSHSLNKLMNLVNHSCHLIAKEEMVHKHALVK